MKVKRVVSKVGNQITYEFTDGSTGVLEVSKDARGFMKFGEGHTLTPVQFLVVSTFNAVADRPDGGWL